MKFDPSCVSLPLARRHVPHYLAGNRERSDKASAVSWASANRSPCLSLILFKSPSESESALFVL